MSWYVGNIAIYYSVWSTLTVEGQLHIAVKCLSYWALDNGFFFFAAKMQCLYFTRLQGLQHPHTLHFNSIALLFVPSLKSLDLVFDSFLIWEPHLRWLCVKCDQLLNILKVLCGRFWG